MSSSGHDDAVTPLIGTILVLGITVSGIAVTLLMGQPVLTNLRDRAALENVVGQLEDVRAAGNDMYVPDESRYPTLSLPAGQATLGPGSHILVTVDHDAANTGCDLRVTGWQDFGSTLTVTTTGCRTPSTVKATCDGTGTETCFEVVKVSGTTKTVENWASHAGSVVTLSAPIDEDSDYSFRLTNNKAEGDILFEVYAEAWLFHMDRLSWDGGNVNAIYEGGAVFAQEGTGQFIGAAPLVSEEPPGGPYFLRMATLQNSAYAQVTGSGSHSIGLVMQGGHLRVDWADARLLRFDFQGDRGEPWCNSFLLRDSLASLGADYYTRSDGEAGPCAEDQDGIWSIRYFEPAVGATPAFEAFPFTLSQTIIHGSLLL